MSPSRRTRSLVIGLAAVAGGVAVKEGLGPDIVPSVYLTFYAAVLLSAVYGGLWPGLLTTALSALAGWYLYILPSAGEHGYLVGFERVVLFTLISAAACAFVHRMHLARDALRAAKEELEQRVAERTAALQAANARLQDELAERHRVANALRQSEENYRQISELASDYAYRFRIEPNGRVVFEWWAGAFSRITGFQPEEIRGLRGIDALIHRDDFPAVVDHTMRLLGGQTVAGEFRIRTKDGGYRWLRNYSRPEWDEIERRVVRVYGAARDITERKRAEDELRLSEERFALAVSGANDGIWDWEFATDRIYLSPRLREIIGLNLDVDVADLGLWRALLHPDDLERVTEQLRRHLAGDGDLLSNEYRLRHSDGTYRSVVSRGIVRRDAGGKPCRMAGSLTDVTARRHADEEARRREIQLAHAQRLSTLGEMAAGLAHELNQPLAAIVSFARGCVRRLRGGETRPSDLLHPIEQIARQALRAGEVLQRYRNFVRSDTRREWVDLNTLVREVSEFASAAALDERAVIRLDLARDTPPALVDAVQIQQVLLNLIRNGMEAMRGRGREIWVRTRVAGDAAEIAVEDAGGGIPEDIREQIFDAFFSTKTDGLGMGLSISRSIIDAHGGKLWPTANSGAGTTFHFTVPFQSPDVDLPELIREESGLRTED